MEYRHGRHVAQARALALLASKVSMEACEPGTPIELSYPVRSEPGRGQDEEDGSFQATLGFERHRI